MQHSHRSAPHQAHIDIFLTFANNCIEFNMDCSNLRFGIFGYKHVIKNMEYQRTFLYTVIRSMKNLTKLTLKYLSKNIIYTNELIHLISISLPNLCTFIMIDQFQPYSDDRQILKTFDTNWLQPLQCLKKLTTIGIIVAAVSGYSPFRRPDSEFVQTFIIQLLKQIILIPSIKTFIHNGRNQTQEQIQILKQHNKDINLTNELKMYN
jgi:hypothetical protein